MLPSRDQRCPACARGTVSSRRTPQTGGPDRSPQGWMRWRLQNDACLVEPCAKNNPNASCKLHDSHGLIDARDR
jgi:hypothetical protein